MASAVAQRAHIIAMSPIKRNINMHITLPPRHFMALTHSGASSPSTPSPHTPLPFEYSLPPSIASSSHESLDLGDLDASAWTIGSKRARDEEDVNEDVDWDESEIATIESVLHHPPQRLRFAPNSLPEDSILDELTNHILCLPLRTPTKRRPISSQDRSASDDDTSNSQWRHSWDATRKRLYVIALAESKFGSFVEDEKKMTRQEKLSRPGLKRMNSMDFLDEDTEGEKESDRIGRALRLSTSLQNSSKSQSSVDSKANLRTPLISDSPLSFEETPSEPVTSIVITPSSPVSAPPAPAPAMRRRGSHRKSQPGPRPSFLQRNRSFTATDLQVESPESPAKVIVESPTTNLFPETAEISSPCDKPSPHKAFFTASMADALNVPSNPSALPPFLSERSSRTITRSQSSLTFTAQTPNAQRDNFLHRQPMSTEVHTLAIPLSIGNGSGKASIEGSKSDWSDSEDESSAGKPRIVKKMKKQSNVITRTLAVDLNTDGLRSPFEEKAEITF